MNFIFITDMQSWKTVKRLMINVIGKSLKNIRNMNNPGQKFSVFSIGNVHFSTSHKI